jgi:hypothetical protein
MVLVTAAPVIEWVPGQSAPSSVAPLLAAGSPHPVLGASSRGFPRSATPAREWVPGLSTPEGVMLTSLTAAAAVAVHYGTVERFVHTVSTMMMVGVSGGVPASAFLFGTSLIPQ